MAAIKQLLSTIDDQQDKIARYETRLGDLIRAYKGLVKEKDALQTALSVVAVNPKEDKTVSLGGNDCSPNVTPRTLTDDGFQTDEAKHICSLEERVKTLTQSLNDLLEERNRLEAIGKEDRKRLLDEKRKMELNLQKLEQQCSESSLMENLQSQIAELKMHYGQTIKQEQLQSERAEIVCRNMSNTHEERVAFLECRLQELSMTVANKDRLTQSHLNNIHELKEKLEELTDERMSYSFDLLNEKCIEVPYVDLSAINVFEKLWNDAKSKGEFEVLKDYLSLQSEIHDSCHLSYATLKSEFDAMKIAFGDRKSDTSPVCSCGLKEQVNELREGLRAQISSTEGVRISHTHQIDSLNQQIISLKQSHKESLDQTILDYRAQISSLELKISEHCQRSLSTLQQRDEEIHTLTQDLHRMSKEAKTQPSTIAAALLSQVGATPGLSSSDGPLLHHLEEMARKQIELNQISIEKRQLERALREIQVNSVMKQEKMQDQMEDLREELERYKRNMSREGFSHEYLKNVVVQYMTTTDNDARLTMANAISVILKFSPEEGNRVRKFLKQYWWQSRPQDTGRHRLASLSDDVSKIEKIQKISMQKFS